MLMEMFLFLTLFQNLFLLNCSRQPGKYFTAIHFLKHQNILVEQRLDGLNCLLIQILSEQIFLSFNDCFRLLAERVSVIDGDCENISIKIFEERILDLQFYGIIELADVHE